MPSMACRRCKRFFENKVGINLAVLAERDLTCYASRHRGQTRQNRKYFMRPSHGHPVIKYARKRAQRPQRSISGIDQHRAGGHKKCEPRHGRNNANVAAIINLPYSKVRVRRSRTEHRRAGSPKSTRSPRSGTRGPWPKGGNFLGK